MKMITIKKTSKMKTVKLNKNSKARKYHLSKSARRADKIMKIIAHVTNMCEYAEENLCTEQCQFEELEEMLWKLANGR